MKNPLKDKFKTNFFVKPLYKKTKVHDWDNVEKGTMQNKTKCFDRTVKLCGGDYNVKAVITKNGASVINVKRKISKEYKVSIPGACYSDYTSEKCTKNCKEIDLSKLICKTVDKDDKFNSMSSFNKNMIGNSKSILNDTINKEGLNTEDDKQIVILHKEPDTWLRVYPAPKLQGETLYSIILRCVLCQLGLATFLILWTIIGVFVIQSFEGPHETKVSLEFEKEQNQLVIDLATELRQITPLSPKWRHAIERRMEDERKLTMLAVDNGARLKPGQFWNLSGTFLFAVYVMTALGFGAPVPHTVWGRISALIYAFLAIPTHIYLMVNASTCLVVYLERYSRSLRDVSASTGNPAKSIYLNKRDSPNCSRNSEVLKSSKRTSRKAFICCLGVVGAGRCIPVAAVSYYTLGVVSFGVLRDKTLFETLMFPLEFTTTGGLEHVESYVRVVYGLYVEGAMCLLACTLATLRRTSSGLSCLTHTQRLWETNDCHSCVKTQNK